MEKFKVPTPEEVRRYGLELNYRIDGERFCLYYEQKGWMVGKSPMKSWKAAIKLWKMNAKENELFKPIPKESDGERKKRLLGAKLCLWCKPPGNLEFSEERNGWFCRNCGIDHTKFFNDSKGL